MAKQYPKSIGFIMDGNRRFAKERGEASISGHQKGAKVFRECILWVEETGIPDAVFYGFSTENWNRSREEVAALMDLFSIFLAEMEAEYSNQSTTRFRVVGQREDFSENLQEQINQLEKINREKEVVTTIWVALSYGGRAELVAAANAVIREGKEVDEDSLASHLWTAELPEVDMIIRTGGEQRLSGFLTWKSVYSELFFTNTYWPAFTKDEFLSIVEEYANRERRRGK